MVFPLLFQGLQGFSTMPVTVPVNANSSTGHFSGSSGGGSDVGGGHSPAPGHPPSTTSSLQIPVSPGGHHMASPAPTSPRPTSCNG